MKTNQKIWALFVELSLSQWQPKREKVEFDEEYWNELIKKCADTGINTIVIDVGDGVQYESHPEIVIDGAWSKEKVLAEVKKCREYGIELIPKLNFSTGHAYWMGEYRRMTSSTRYYNFCHNILREIYEMFDKPSYIHLGMDEENIITTACAEDVVIYRKNEVLIKDLKFLFDEVNSLGAKPWIWHEPLVHYTEIYEKFIGPDEAVISPWWYWSYTEDEHFPIISDIDNHYYDKGIRYEKDVPMRVEFMQKIVPLLEKGYKYIPTPSTFYCPETNTDDTLKYFKENCPDEQIIGYMTAPWREIDGKYKDTYDLSLDLLKVAREKYYGK